MSPLHGGAFNDLQRKLRRNGSQIWSGDVKCNSWAQQWGEMSSLLYDVILLIWIGFCIGFYDCMMFDCMMMYDVCCMMSFCCIGLYRRLYFALDCIDALVEAKVSSLMLPIIREPSSSVIIFKHRHHHHHHHHHIKASASSSSSY